MSRELYPSRRSRIFLYSALNMASRLHVSTVPAAAGNSSVFVLLGAPVTYLCCLAPALYHHARPLLTRPFARRQILYWAPAGFAHDQAVPFSLSKTSRFVLWRPQGRIDLPRTSKKGIAHAPPRVPCRFVSPDKVAAVDIAL
ncbi:hypothetical protein BC834DRAFT_343758 [Gloeopeniophorella convolvens]|nr:hypothetical protein BC834DRAFT_343758 [Gloeopeniophorella convolvens]